MGDIIREFLNWATSSLINEIIVSTVSTFILFLFINKKSKQKYNKYQYALFKDLPERLKSGERIMGWRLISQSDDALEHFLYNGMESIKFQIVYEASKFLIEKYPELIEECYKSYLQIEGEKDFYVED